METGSVPSRSTERVGVLRPLVVFPEGAVSRTNDKLQSLLDGVAFIARTAAKRRARHSPPGKVVVHPMAIKYRLLDPLEQSIEPTLRQIEQRFTWRERDDLNLIDRVRRVGNALLSLKEVEYLGRPQQGSTSQRIQGLLNHLVDPLEQEWFGETREHMAIVPRVKAVRMRILPDMIHNRCDKPERERRWAQLADLYLAQQISCYPPDYLDEKPTVDRIYETVERFYEDMTDRTAKFARLKVIHWVGPAIEVSPRRDRSAKTDPLMAEIGQQIQSMLDTLADESPLYEAAVGQ